MSEDMKVGRVVFGPLTDSPEITALLERARNHVMTPAETRAQKVSFVKGQTGHDEAMIRKHLGFPTIEEEATLSALRSGEMVAVPREPTDDMLTAIESVQVGGDLPIEAESRAIYRAMLAAAKDARHD